MSLLRNAARCHRCGDTIESKHGHDFVRCSCGGLFVDGGLGYARRGWSDGVTYDELSEQDADEHVSAWHIANLKRGVRNYLCGKPCEPSVAGASAGMCILAPEHEGECSDAVCLNDVDEFLRVGNALLRRAGRPASRGGGE